MKCPECGRRFPADLSVCPSCGAGISPDGRPDPEEVGTGNERRLSINNYGMPIARENLKGVILGLIIVIALTCIAIVVALTVLHGGS
jgi:hypothetical protein